MRTASPKQSSHDKRSSQLRAIGRGLRVQCPACGSGQLFESRLRMRRTCPGCQLDFERNPGAFIGGIGLNTSVVTIMMVGALIASFLFVPDPWYLRLLPVLAVALVLPVLFFRRSKTLWLAFEYLATPPEEPRVEQA